MRIKDDVSRMSRHALEEEVRRWRKEYVTGVEVTKQAYHEFEIIQAALMGQAFEVDSARNCIFKALVFRDSPTWRMGLKQHQDTYNNHVTQLINLINRIKEENQENPVFIDLLTEMENDVRVASGEVNDALTWAIGHKNPTQLEELAKRKNTDIKGIFENYLNEFRTDEMLRDSKYSRAGIYIGNYCNMIEGEGIIAIRNQWKACYQHLKCNQMMLAGDELEAWKWFQDRDAHGIEGVELRRFEKEISYFKGIMPTSDKVRTIELKDSL